MGFGIGTTLLVMLLFIAPTAGWPSTLKAILVVSLPALALFVTVAREALSAGSERGSSVLILGNGELAGELRHELSQVRTIYGRQLMPAIVDPSGASDVVPRLKELILKNRVSDVVITDPSIGTYPGISSLLIECKFRGVKITRAPEFYEGIHKKMWLEALRPEAFVYSDAINPTRSYLIAKRTLDLTCAAGVFVLTFPLMLLIALAIKLETPGPVFFRQERVGRFGSPFTLYKFRSMRADAEKDTGPVWARENDDRVTKVGRILRSTHLDEIPQILNVLRNELSFVGPRPERECFIQELEKRIPYFRLREYVKPGITGWAQVRAAYGDSILASAEKLRFDLYYAKHASLLFDLKVLLLTVWHVAFGRGR